MRNFLGKLKNEGKLRLVEPSQAISEAYLQKAGNCLKGAKILSHASLHENAIAEAYYAMYNALQSCLWKCGIRCENHAASIFLVTKLFEKPDLGKRIERAKKERIDKQYYVTGEMNEPLTGQASDEMILEAEESISEFRVILQSLDGKAIKKARDLMKGG